MKWRLSLQTKILLLAFLNIALLVTVFLVFARVQFRLDLGSFLLAPARDKILSASRLAALELPNTPREKWDSLLAQFTTTIPAELSLFDREGTQLAGKNVVIPKEIQEVVRREPRYGNGDRPPRFEPHEPGPDEHGPEPPAPDAGGPAYRQRPFSPERPRDPAQQLVFTHTLNPSQYWAATRVPLFGAPGRPPMRVTLVWRFDSLWTNSFFFDYRPWLAIIALIALISVACWLPFIRGLTHSISALKTATGQIADGQFAVQLPVKRRDEIGQLSESIRQMAQSLAGYVTGQKRFLGDIAHELCSPIARVQMALGILDQRASAEEQPYVASVYEEIQHMSGLVNELLSFSKASLGATTDLESVNVAETVRRAVEREAPEGSSIEAKIDPRLAVVAQPDYLFRSISNVLRNAIRYAGQAGPIHISAQQDAENIHITIADEGPGVPAAELEEIMRPFYRPESARQRETGGVGLGLAIVRTCMEACGGKVVCRNRVPKGFEVELSLTAA
jgi:two-component system sensor histidine kinase CpxA